MITRMLCDVILKDVRNLYVHLDVIAQGNKRHKIQFELFNVGLRMSSSNRDIVTVENDFELYMFLCSDTEFWIKPSVFIFGDKEYEIERKYINDEAYMFQRSLVEDTFSTDELNEIYAMYDKVQNLRDLWGL